MENPFLYGDIVQSPYFADREDEIHELQMDLSSGQNVLIFSPRRYGKSSLVLKVLNNLRASGLITIYVDLFWASSIEKFIKLYTTAIAIATATKFDGAIRFVKEHFPMIIPKVILKTETPLEVEFDFESSKRDQEQILNSLYDLPQKIAEKRKRRCVVAFDEFQEIIFLNADIERQLRSKIQHHDKVAYCFLGSKRHLLNELFQDKNKPLYKIAKSMPLNRIPSDKLQRFIQSRFKTGRININRGLVEEILDITLSHPYHTQQLCHELYNVCFPRKVITKDDITKAKQKCIHSQSYAYTTIWDGLSAKQRELILAIASTPRASIYSQDFINKYSLGASATVQRAADALEKKGLIDRENSNYVISDAFFGEWIKERGR